MRRFIVTGGSGGAGRFVVAELRDTGHDVLILDRVLPRNPSIPFYEVDLTDYPKVASAMDGYDAVVHLAAQPEPDFDFDTGAERFRNNTLATYNVFNAAADTIMNRPNREPIAAVFPDVPIVEGTGDFDTLLSIDKVREVLGFEPRYSWRDVLQTKE